MPLKVLITRILLITASLSICTAIVATLEPSGVEAESPEVSSRIDHIVCPTPTPTPTPPATPTATATPTPVGTATPTPTAPPTGCPPTPIPLQIVSFVNPAPISPAD